MITGRIINWGILGFARIAKQSFIPALLRAENSSLKAIASNSAERRDECRSLYPHCTVYQSYNEILKDPAIDALYIPLPNHLHKEWTKRAAEHGKHVLCEKPLALTESDAREMSESCSSKGLLLAEAFMYRYNDKIKTVRNTIKKGVLGEIKYIHAEFRFLLERPGDYRFNASMGGGSLYDVGCYPIDFLTLLIDETPYDITARKVLHNGVDIQCEALISYPSGLIASIGCGFNAAERVNASITGTNGTLDIPDTFWGKQGSLTLHLNGTTETIPIQESDSYRLEIEDFANSILEKKQITFSLDQTFKNLNLLEKLIRFTTPK